jgi:DNA-directed RNA polymerase specialized sigma24 family protein
LVTCTFERFWQAVGPDRFERFRDKGALLSYLKLCAASVVLDEARRRRRPVEILSLDQLSDHTGEATQVPGRAPDPEFVSVARMEREDLWAAVRRLLPAEAERRVVYLRFALGLTPQEIVRQCPERYSTATEVYRVTRKALNRLRRSPQIRGFRRGGSGDAGHRPGTIDRR